MEAQTHRSAIPCHLAHVAQGALEETTACGQRQQAHAGRDPLLRFTALAHRHEELDGTVHGTAMAVRHRQERDDQVQRLVAFLRPVLELFGHGREHALGTAFDHGAHRVDGRCGHGQRRCSGFGGLGLRCHFEHGAQNAVRAVRGQTLQSRMPGLQIQVLEIGVRVVFRHVDGLGDGGVHVGLHRFHHRHVITGGHVHGAHEVLGQRIGIAAERLEQTPCVVFDDVFALAAIGLALAARVAPREWRLDTVRCVVRKGQAHRAGRRDRQQVAVANAVLANRLLEFLRQAAGKGAGGQVAIRIELGEHALFLGQLDRCGIRGIAHVLGDLHGHVAAFFAVVAQLEHRQRVAHAGKAHADTALGGRFGTLLLERPERQVEHVVERAHLQRHRGFKRLEIEFRRAVNAERVAHKARQDDRAQIAAAIRRQRLLAAGVGGLDLFCVVQVVVGVDLVEEQNARLGEVVGRLHDRVPQLASAHGAVDPLAVRALACAFLLQIHARRGFVHQFPLAIGFDGLHEVVGHAHGHVEIVPTAWSALGGDEVHHIRVIDAQHAHLSAAACAGAFNGRARLVEHIDVAARARGHRGRALDEGTARTDAREVVAHATTTAHGLGGFAQCFVDAGKARVIHALNTVAHRLHEAVDQGGLNVGTGCTHDAASADGAEAQVVEEARFHRLAKIFALYRCQCAGHAAIQLFYIFLVVLEVFFAQDVETDGLHRQRGSQISGFAFHGWEYSESKGKDRNQKCWRSGS